MNSSYNWTNLLHGWVMTAAALLVCHSGRQAPYPVCNATDFMYFTRIVIVKNGEIILSTNSVFSTNLVANCCLIKNDFHLYRASFWIDKNHAVIRCLRSGYTHWQWITCFAPVFVCRSEATLANISVIYGDTGLCVLPIFFCIRGTVSPTCRIIFLSKLQKNVLDVSPTIGPGWRLYHYRPDQSAKLLQDSNPRDLRHGLCSFNAVDRPPSPSFL